LIYPVIFVALKALTELLNGLIKSKSNGCQPGTPHCSNSSGRTLGTTVGHLGIATLSLHGNGNSPSYNVKSSIYDARYSTLVLKACPASVAAKSLPILQIASACWVDRWMQ